MLERKKLGPQEALTITDSRRRPTCGIEADFFTVDRVGKEAETAELNRGPTHFVIPAGGYAQRPYLGTVAALGWIAP